MLSATQRDVWWLIGLSLSDGFPTVFRKTDCLNHDEKSQLQFNKRERVCACTLYVCVFVFFCVSAHAKEETVDIIPLSFVILIIIIHISHMLIVLEHLADIKMLLSLL